MDRGLIAWLVSLVVALVPLGVAGCSPLTAYNALTPADGGAVLARSDVAYGRHPRQTLDVYVPANRPTAAPVVVAFYGGSWNSGRRQDYAFLGKALSAQGFVVIIADYRLVPEVRFPGFLEDSADAVAWTYRNAATFGGDPARLYLFGHSAGAYNAAMVALDGRYLRRAGIDPAVVKGVAALAGPYDFLPLDLDVTRAAFGGAADLAATQPINFVSPGAPPMLLATGADDTTVYPRNSEALAERLRRVGTPVSVRRYPGIGHIGIMLALSRPFRGNAAVLADVAQFVRGGT
jgi:acetyl esterase/lipase